MRQSIVGSAVVFIMGTALLLGAVQAQTKEPASEPASAQTKPKVKKKKAVKTAGVAKTGSAKFMPGSQESASQRSSRLTRECKGAVNAGACSGYASQ